MIGPNGAGKTTFFNCVTGFYPPTAGAVTFKGQNITGWSSEKVCDIGITRTFQIVIDITAPGSPHPAPDVANDADLRFDLPRYHVYQNGEVVDEPTDIADLWQNDSVAFLLGCSFTFEEALLAAGLPVRHQECGCNVPMYRTNQTCTPTTIFQGPLVVSMRPFPAHLVDQVAKLTEHYSLSHGAPVHIGHPDALGIQDITQPDYGDPVPIHPDEVPIFWACGVTPQAIAQAARIPWMITHAPGHMFITDPQAICQKGKSLSL